MNYFLAVEVEIEGAMADLCGALRQTFENGATGDFQILRTTREGLFMVLFERNAVTDAEYVSKRLNESTSVELAAMHQLADELEEAGAETFATQIVTLLRKGNAECFDFCMGAIESMAEFEPEPV